MNILENKKELTNILLIILLSILIFLLTFTSMEKNKINVEIGDYATEDLRAVTETVDVVKTERLKKEARKNAEVKYRILPSVQMGMKDKVNKLFKEVRSLKVNEELSNKEKSNALKQVISIDIPEELMLNLIKTDMDELDNFENVLLDLISQIMAGGIKDEDIQYEKDNLKELFTGLNISDKQGEIGLFLMEKILQPNQFEDEEETEKNRLEAAEKIEPVIIKENEIIVSKGERISSYKYNLLKETGLVKLTEGQGLKNYLGVLVLILLVMALLYKYIVKYNEDILLDGRYKALLLIFFVVVSLSSGVYKISPYLLPISSSALLISVLIEPQLAMVVNTLITVYLAFLLRLDVSIIFMSIVSSALAVINLKDERDRANLLVNGVIIGVCNVLIITAFGLVRQTGLKDIFVRDIQVFLNGVIAVIITIGSLPLWEKMFNILTPVRLSELSNPNQPLIKRMLLEAPGTYHHSLIVGNLAEAAAEAVGASPLLTRVGSYYHDIGKMKTPYYFKENQFGMDNPHDKLSPIESAKIILNHTIEGEKMGKQYKLPQEIVDFTIEHHGTTNVAYFYYQAKKLDENASIEDYTYKGRKPQSIETAIVMMADSVEAAVRSIEKPTLEKIEEMTNKVIRGKIDQGQMDECDLTNKDIHIISSSFVQVLKGIYHDRIAYPDDDEKKGE